MEALIGAFLGLPLIAIPIFIANAIFWHRKSQKDEAKYKQATTKNCPDCLASIPKLAKKCMHCGTTQPSIPTN
jgi:ribosomal protein L40E